jgi:hypothetical protein
MYRTIFLALVSRDSGAFWRILADFGLKTPILAFILLLVDILYIIDCFRPK